MNGEENIKSKVRDERKNNIMFLVKGEVLKSPLQNNVMD